MEYRRRCLGKSGPNRDGGGYASSTEHQGTAASQRDTRMLDVL